MSRRDAGAARQHARHAEERLKAALGEAPPGLLQQGHGLDGFEYRGAGETAETDPGSGAEDRSSGVPSLRWRVGLRLSLLLGALAVAAGAWFWLQAGAATPEVLPLSGVSSEGKTAGPAETTAEGVPPRGPDGGQGGPKPGGLVVVHVAGAVATPGVIRLQQGSRVDDAIAAAGGPGPDADVNRLNLALAVEDGQKIYVPQRGEQVSSVPDAGSSGAAGQEAEHGAPGGKVNLNTADAAELDTLPKVGPVLAQRIVGWRKEHGPFKSVEELDAVDGVGPKMLETLLPLVTV